MARTNRPITVTLGELLERVDARHRDEAAVDKWLRRKVEEAFSDDRPSAAAEDVFGRLRQHHAARAKAERRPKRVAKA